VTASTPEVDSRQYIFAYLIRSLEDVPADFPIPAADGGFRLGLFLPRDEPDWFGRSTYPTRILLLSGGAIVILPHPKTREPVIRIPLQELLFVEAGHILLIGWLRFVEKESEHKLPYNTRSGRSVEEFLRVLLEEYLPETLDLSPCGRFGFGEPLDLKFRNAEYFELDAGERVLLRFFSPATKKIRRRWIFPWQSRVPGDLVALTNRRVLWITDRVQERYEPYGTVTRSAPVRALTQLTCRRTEESCALLVRFSSDASWRIPLPLDRQAEAQRFAEEGACQLIAAVERAAAKGIVAALATNDASGSKQLPPLCLRHLYLYSVLLAKPTVEIARLLIEEQSCRSASAGFLSLGRGRRLTGVIAHSR